MFDVLVIGAGHAGCEAAAAAARRGAKVGLLTFRRGGCGADVLQPLDRRRRQGPPGSRTRRIRWAHGARSGPGGNPPPDAQSEQGSRGLGATSAGRPARCTARQSLSSFAQTKSRSACREALGLLIVGGGWLASNHGGTLDCRAVVIATGTFLDARHVHWRAGDRGRPAWREALLALAHADP